MFLKYLGDLNFKTLRKDMMIMFHFFHRYNSGNKAKDRLKIMLVSDRINCTPEMMEILKNEIALVISKYMMIDEENMEIRLCKSGKSLPAKSNSPHLYASIPILELKYNKI